MRLRHRQPTRWGLVFFMAFWMLVVLPIFAAAAPYAGFVMDARNGKVLYSENADARLHPASLTKMMTLYLAFEAVKHGEISLDTEVRVSKRAASEPPSKLGLRPGQRIALRYLIRAAAVKSANDAATAIAEAISGSVPNFANRMNRTARSMGMTRTTFKNANGLTQDGHLSTARDMSILGRHLFYDYPEYYNLFSRITINVNGKTLRHTNRKLLQSYRGADGIKTGYTRAAGFNLVASAERGRERIIATVFGGKTSASRNAQVAHLLDLGFKKARSRAKIIRPKLPTYYGPGRTAQPVVASAGTVQTAAASTAPTRKRKQTIAASPRPQRRTPPAAKAPAPVVQVAKADIESAVIEAVTAEAVAATADVKPPEKAPTPLPFAVAAADTKPRARPQALVADVADKSIDKSTDQIAEQVASQVAAQLATTGTPAKQLQDSPDEAAPQAEAQAEVVVASATSLMPRVRPQDLVAKAEPAKAEIAVAEAAPAVKQPPKPQQAEARPKSQKQELITRVSTSGGRHWGVNIGRYPSQASAQRMLLKTALAESSSLDGSLRKVVQRSNGFDANFMGLSREMADLACRRLQARQISCFTIGPG